jgi:hypothetical protein
MHACIERADPKEQMPVAAGSGINDGRVPWPLTLPPGPVPEGLGQGQLQVLR